MGVKYFLLNETAGASDSVSNQRLTDYKSDTIPTEPRRPYFIRAVRSPLRPVQPYIKTLLVLYLIIMNTLVACFLILIN